MQNGATNTTDEAGGEMITGALCVCACVCACVYVCIRVLLHVVSVCESVLVQREWTLIQFVLVSSVKWR